MLVINRGRFKKMFYVLEGGSFQTDNSHEALFVNTDTSLGEVRVKLQQWLQYDGNPRQRNWLSLCFVIVEGRGQIDENQNRLLSCHNKVINFIVFIYETILIFLFGLMLNN